jgi:chemotaxis signal transduction protein
MTMMASLTLSRPASLTPEDGAWTGFELDGAVYALPNHSVERVLSATPVTQLPFAPPAVEGVASISGDVLPVLALRILLTPDQPPPVRPTPDFVVIRVAQRRYALRADRVLFIADRLPDFEPPAESSPPAIDALADWRGLPVRCLSIDRLGIEALQPFLPPRRAPGPIADSRITAEAAAAASETVLTMRAGGKSYGLRATSVVEMLEDVAITRLPLVPAELLGMAVVRASPVLAFSLARLRGGEPAAMPGGYVVVNAGGNRFVLAVDAIGGLRRLSAARGDRSGASADPELLDPVALFTPKWLAMAAKMPEMSAAAPVTDQTRQRFLCVSLGTKACALPLAAVERILPPRTPIRLPAGAPSGVDGAIEFGGRVIPVTEGWRWLSQPDGGPVAAHVVLQHDGERRVLTVNAIQRIVTIAHGDILQPGIADLRIAGLGQVSGRLLAILSTAALLSRGPVE